jgi:hypothetical protein
MHDMSPKATMGCGCMSRSATAMYAFAPSDIENYS